MFEITHKYTAEGGKKNCNKISKQPIGWYNERMTYVYIFTQAIGIMFTKVYCIYIHVFQEAVKVAIQTRLFDWPSICSLGRYPKETICGLELGFFSFIFIIIFFFIL